MKKLVVLVSGGGSNLQTILDDCANGKIEGKVVAVISNRPAVMGLQRAVKAGADAITLDHKAYDNRASFDEALKKRIDAYQPDFIVLAGFMRILTAEFVQHYLGKMVNIHPSLLPKYPGLNTHQRALETGDSHGGATVHFVTPELDGGPLILQAQVPILKDDNELALSKRVLQAEHLIYPTVVQWLCSSRLTLTEGLAALDGELLQIPKRFNHNEI